MSNNNILVTEPEYTIFPLNEKLIEVFKSKNSKIIYETILKSVPKDKYLDVNSFSKKALKELNSMNFPSSFDCIADVIRVLSGLVSSGLVSSSYQIVKEVYTEHDRVCGSVVKYKLATDRNFL